jgi:hypothetical protein
VSAASLIVRPELPRQTLGEVVRDLSPLTKDDYALKLAGLVSATTFKAAAPGIRLARFSAFLSASLSESVRHHDVF